MTGSTDSSRTPFFGRERDLKVLLERITQPGVSAIEGMPRIGKSRLLRELAYIAPGHGSFAIGYAQASGGTPDLLLEALSDLYACRLRGTVFREEAERFLAEHKAVPSLDASGTVADVLFSALKDPESASDDTVRRAFRALCDRHWESAGGNLPKPPIPYDIVLELVQHFHRLSQRIPVIILDAVDQLQDPKPLIAFVREYLDNLVDWPPIHVVLAVRDNAPPDEVQDAVRDLQVDVYPLDRMDLSDPEEASRVVEYVRSEIPGAAKLEDKHLLDLLDGHPGILDCWRRNKPADVVSLRDLAVQARTYRYDTLRARLLTIAHDDPNLLGVAARTALLPEITTEYQREAYAPLILGDTAKESIEALRAALIFDPENALPAFEHTTAYEAVRETFLQEPELVSLTKTTAEDLAVVLAGNVKGVSEPDMVRVLALAQLEQPLANVQASRRAFVVVAVAELLFLGRMPAAVERLMPADREEDQRRPQKPISPEIALELLRLSLSSVKADGEVDPDVFLAQMIALCENHPDNEDIREMIALGRMMEAGRAYEEGDALRSREILDMMRSMHRENPGEHSASALAVALFAASERARREGDIANCRALVDELGALCDRFPGNATIREQWAQALYNQWYYARQDGKRDICDKTEGQIRTLHQSFPKDEPLRKILADILFDRLDWAVEKTDITHLGSVLDALRTLHGEYPDDEEVLGELAFGLRSMLRFSVKDERIERCDEMLEELRSLRSRHPNNGGVQENLAMGLFNALSRAEEKGDLSQRDNFLDELSKFANEFPDDASIRNGLAMALANTAMAAPEEGGLPRVFRLVDHLRRLHKDHPEDQVVIAMLAHALDTAHSHAQDGDSQDTREDLLNELHSLVEQYPDNADLWGYFALALSTEAREAQGEGSAVRREALLKEVKEIYERYPENPDCLEALIKVIEAVISDVEAQGDNSRSAALREELETLKRAERLSSEG